MNVLERKKKNCTFQIFSSKNFKNKNKYIETLAEAFLLVYTNNSRGKHYFLKKRIK